MDFKNIQLNRPEEVVEPVAVSGELTKAETDKIEQIIESLSKAEKIIAVRSFPTEILQNEISRRLKRDKDQRNALRDMVNAMDKY